MINLQPSEAHPDPVRDITFAGLSARNRLDLYLPQGTANPPLVLFIHGGAFKMGDKANQDGSGLIGKAALLAAGFAVASVNYRYSTEAIWPAQLNDLRAALAFLRGNAVRLGFDGGRIASFGPSAGGHLSAMCGIAFAEDPLTRLKASVVWYPPVDFPTMDEDMLASGVERATGRNDAADSPESLLVGALVSENPAQARSASPLTYLAGLPAGTPLPAFLIMHGAKDPYIAARQSERLHEGLAAFGTAPALELSILPDGTHGGGDFELPQTMAHVVSFLSTAFGE
jgi:acetyl esterase/lipase